MLEEKIFKFRAARSKITIHRTASFINTKQIRLGHRCSIGRYCYLKGGEDREHTLVVRDDVIIKHGAYISVPYSNLEIQRYCHIGHFCWIGGRGNIIIEENSLIAMNVVIISSNHNYRHIHVPYYDGSEMAMDIVIGKNVWIGASCVILPGVNIGQGAVVAAGSIVRNSVEPNSIVSGNPAQVIGRLHR